MINVLYISESAKKANKFFCEMKSELENLGISEIEEDRKNCLIRAKGFTIKANYIYDSYIPIDCENCNFLILDFELGENADRIFQKFEHLKCCFHEWTIYLRGKEELIEIMSRRNESCGY